MTVNEPPITCRLDIDLLNDDGVRFTGADWERIEFPPMSVMLPFRKWLAIGRPLSVNVTIEPADDQLHWRASR